MKTANIRIKLRQARKEKGLKREEVAREIGISRNFYSQIERGDRNPRFDYALKISEFFNLDIRDWK